MVRARPLFFILGAIAVVHAMAYVDLTFRARSAYMEGEKYMEWYRRPELRKRYFETRFNEQKSKLDAERAAGRMAEVEYRQRLELAKFERDDASGDSSIKQAYHWFQAAAELYTSQTPDALSRPVPGAGSNTSRPASELRSFGTSRTNEAPIFWTPPESRWVKLSREKMKEAKQLWKAELDAAKISYQEYMLE